MKKYKLSFIIKSQIIFFIFLSQIVISQTGKDSVVVDSLSGFQTECYSVAFSKDGSLFAAAGLDVTQDIIKVWDTKKLSGAPLYTLKGHTNIISSIVFSSDGSKLISGDYDGNLIIWDTKTGDSIPPAIRKIGDAVRSVAFVPNGNILVVGYSSGFLRLMDLSNRKILFDTVAHDNTITSLSFSGDGKSLVSGSIDNNVKVWDVNTLKLKYPAINKYSAVYTVAFSPDNSKIAFSDDAYKVYIYDANTGSQIIPRLDAHTDYVRSLTFRQDSKILASAGWDATIYLWHLDSAGYTGVCDTIKTSGKIFTITYNNDGSILATGGKSQSILIRRYIKPIPPTTTTTPTTSFTTSYAVLSGTVNPKGYSTTAWFVYDSTANISSPKPTTLKNAGSSTNDTIITDTIKNLTSSMTYYYRIFAQNNAGRDSGNILSFTTKGVLPKALTDSVRTLDSISAILSGSANPNGLPTKVYFEYDTNKNLIFAIKTQALSIGQGRISFPINQPISGLSPNTTYYYTLVAENSVGEIEGDTLSFTTLSGPPPPPPPPPVKPLMNVNTDSLQFFAVQNGLLPARQPIRVNSLNTSILKCTIVASSGITTNISSFTGDTTFYVSINSTNLSPGNYDYLVAIIDTNAQPAGKSVKVKFTVIAATMTLNKTISIPNIIHSAFISTNYPIAAIKAEYKLIGIPGNPNEIISNFLTGTQGVDWEVFNDNGQSSDYYEKYDGSDKFKLTTGKAFWVTFKGNVVFSKTVNFPPITDKGEIEIPLQNGWNLITNPVTKSINWSDIQTYNSITLPITSYNNNSMTAATSFEPYIGYLFENKNNLKTIKIPASLLSQVISAKKTNPDIFWSADVGLKSKDGLEIDNSTSFGTAIDPEKYQFRKPRFFGDQSLLYFVSSGEKYSTDFKLKDNDINRWKIFFEGKSGDYELNFTGLDKLPNDCSAFMLDDETGKIIDLNLFKRYKFQIKNSSDVQKRSFTIVVGKSDKIVNETDIQVKEYELFQNFPNPFNPSTKIYYSIPKESNVKIIIYDSFGREVAVLLDKKLSAGRYSTEWVPKSAQGGLPSGIYFYKLITENFIDVKKMIYIK